MENQHRLIKGYRELGEAEIGMINHIKSLGEGLEGAVSDLRHSDADQRWVSIAETHLQQGLMALTRAVAKPDFF
jgi:hypothetical protein